MANQILAVNTPEVKTTNIDIETPEREYNYELAIVTPRCLVLTANHTGAVRQFRSREALNNFLSALHKYLQEKMYDAMREEDRQVMYDRYHPYGQGI